MNKRMVCLAVAMALNVGVCISPARADTVFDFNGLCAGFMGACSGTATGVLTLTSGYVPGNDITTDVFISFDYSSMSGSLDITSADYPILLGGLNRDGSINSFGFFNITAANGVFQVTKYGSWSMISPPLDDFGAPYELTPVNQAVPEASTWAMMALGFAGIGFAGWRSRKTAASAA
jgi:PEP-CTERM motif